MNSKMLDSDKKKFLHIGYHEAGHLITAKILGFKTGGMSINVFDRDGNHQAHCPIILRYAIRDLDNLVDYCEKRIQVLYAGSIAGSIKENNITTIKAVKDLENEYGHGGGLYDFGKLKELIHIIRNYKHPNTITNEGSDSELQSIADELMNRSAEIVDKNIKLITKLGESLVNGLQYFNQTFALNEESIDSVVKEVGIINEAKDKSRK